MEKGGVILTVLNPRGETAASRQTASVSRLNTLAGKRIGVLSNGKTSGEVLLPFVQAALKKRIPDIEIRVWRVPFADAPELNESKITALAEYADGAVALIGD